ncbi:MAG TPA: Calx-beta domain-containing protein [Actinomycetota bacterium]|nr:Calx-beta domain-containing protein [Actinomycetota bacterium]
MPDGVADVRNVEQGESVTMRTARTTLATAVMSIALLAAAAPAAGGPSGHDVVYLVEQTASGYVPTENYVVVEDAAREALIRREQHGTEVGQVDWSTFAAADDDAAPHDDFHPASGTKSIDPTGVEGVLVDALPDASTEPIETFTFKLSNARGEAGMILRQPSEAKFSIIDVDGAARVGLGTDQYSNFENRGSVRILVVRAGPATTEASTVQYATAPGTATAGSDYTSKTGTLTFEAGSTIPARTETIVVPLLNDSADEPAETFTLALSNPTNATLTTPASATVTIEDDDSPTSDTRAPVTSFHIPRHGETYRPRSLESESAHISPSDDGSGVAKAEFALRKNLRNGDCAWYTGTRFRGGACSSKRWLDAGLDQQCPDPDQCFIVYEYDERLKQTTRSTGIRSYTAFARSHDNAGNVERDFDAGRNKNTFFLKPS